MKHSDGVVLASPTYAFQVTARMKNFLDRTAFINHRPRYFGKTATAIVTHGLPFAGGDTMKYLTFAAENLGFKVSKGCSVTTLDPMTAKQKKILVSEVKKASVRFYKELMRPAGEPSWVRLIGFRFGRNGMKTQSPDSPDYRYYKERGWFKSDYFYPTKLNPVKKLAGSVFDFIGGQMFKHQ